MKENRKEFIFVIGKSEGMDQKAVLAGFNALADEQKKIEDESTYTLVFFNEAAKASAESKALSEIRKYNVKTYVPKGGSALYDAMGYAMDSVGARLADTDESERPARVCVIVFGEKDNASTTYTKEQIAEMVKVQKYTYKWDFVFFGEDGAELDINMGGTLDDVEKAFSQVNDYMTSVR